MTENDLTLLEIKHRMKVTRLKKPTSEVVNEFSLYPMRGSLSHMVIGLAGEVSELLDPLGNIYDTAITPGVMTNIMEELGDIEFYLEGIRQDCEITREETLLYERQKLRTTVASGCRDLTLAVGKVIDAIKKFLYYGQELNKDVLVKALSSFELALEEIRLSLGWKRETVVSINNQKLEIRYSEGAFSNEAAKDRADKQEVQA